MSYILDALKKAERDRGPAEVAQMVTAPDIPRKKKAAAWIIAGCGLLCLVAAGGLFLGMFYGRTESSVLKHATDDQGYAAEDSVAPPENRESIVQSSNTPPVSVEPILNPPAPEAVNVPVAAAPEVKPRAAVVEPVSPAPKAKAEPAVAVVEPVSPAPKAKAEPVVAVVEPVSPAPKAKAEPAVAVVEPVSPAPKAKAGPAVASTVDANMQKSPPVYGNAGLPAPAAAAVEPQQVSVNTPSLREIAASMKMNIGMHVYSDNPEKRLVFINGKRYKEGDLLEQDCVIEGITPEGVLLKRREETVVLRLNGGL